MPSPTTFEFPSARDAKPIRVVGDAAIATGSVSEGRLVPLLIIDVADRPEIAELIRAHEGLQPGDADFRWGQRKRGDGTILLVLEFQRPVVLTMVIAFPIPALSVLVDLILHARAFYLQSGKPGDRWLTTQDHPRLFIEAPHTGFEEVWDNLLLEQVTKHLRQRGLGRSKAKLAAASYVTQMRKLSAGRIRN